MKTCTTNYYWYYFLFFIFYFLPGMYVCVCLYYWLYMRAVFSCMQVIWLVTILWCRILILPSFCILAFLFYSLFVVELVCILCFPGFFSFPSFPSFSFFKHTYILYIRMYYYTVVGCSLTLFCMWYLSVWDFPSWPGFFTLRDHGLDCGDCSSQLQYEYYYYYDIKILLISGI